MGENTWCMICLWKLKLIELRIDKYFLRSVIYGGIMKVLPMEESRT